MFQNYAASSLSFFLKNFYFRYSTIFYNLFFLDACRVVLNVVGAIHYQYVFLHCFKYLGAFIYDTTYYSIINFFKNAAWCERECLESTVCCIYFSNDVRNLLLPYLIKFKYFTSSYELRIKVLFHI